MITSAQAASLTEAAILDLLQMVWIGGITPGNVAGASSRRSCTTLAANIILNCYMPADQVASACIVTTSGVRAVKQSQISRHIDNPARERRSRQIAFIPVARQLVAQLMDM